MPQLCQTCCPVMQPRLTCCCDFCWIQLDSQCHLDATDCSILHIVNVALLCPNCHWHFVGPGDLPGLTDDDKPRMRGPKRASKIRKLFNLTKDDDVRKYVNTYRRSFEGKDGKTHSKAPKIQRLVTPLTLQRKRRRASLNRQRHEKVRVCLHLFDAVPSTAYV